jgi:hypothetical protein
VPSRKTRSKRSEPSRDRLGGWYRAVVGALERFGLGPRDAIGLLLCTGAVVTIVVNALFLQRGPHPAPLFKMALASVSASDTTNTITTAPSTTNTVTVPRPRPAEATPPKVDAGPHLASVEPTAKASGTGATAHGDPIADVLAPSRRIVALQRALAQFGYGQIKPTGVVDAETRVAIEKFERERKLPVTGQPSDRTMRELANLTGRPLD